MESESTEDIRNRLKSLKKNLSQAERGRLSGEIIRRFLEFFDISGSLIERPFRVGLYRALPSEVNLSELEDVLLSQGFLLHYPRVIRSGEQKKIEFVHVPLSDLKTDELDSSLWQVGSYGILEPHWDLKPVSPESLDLIFVPGVAFGESGERLGMGAGFYDRFLSHVPDALRVALAFDFQVLPQLAQEAWDEPVHWVITEKRSFRMPIADEWLEKHLKES